MIILSRKVKQLMYMQNSKPEFDPVVYYKTPSGMNIGELELAGKYYTSKFKALNIDLQFNLTCKIFNPDIVERRLKERKENNTTSFEVLIFGLFYNKDSKIMHYDFVLLDNKNRVIIPVLYYNTIKEKFYKYTKKYYFNFTDLDATYHMQSKDGHGCATLQFGVIANLIKNYEKALFNDSILQNTIVLPYSCFKYSQSKKYLDHLNGLLSNNFSSTSKAFDNITLKKDDLEQYHKNNESLKDSFNQYRERTTFLPLNQSDSSSTQKHTNNTNLALAIKNSKFLHIAQTNGDYNGWVEHKKAVSKLWNESKDNPYKDRNTATGFKIDYLRSLDQSRTL